MPSSEPLAASLLWGHSLMSDSGRQDTGGSHVRARRGESATEDRNVAHSLLAGVHLPKNNFEFFSSVLPAHIDHPSLVRSLPNHFVRVVHNETRHEWCLALLSTNTHGFNARHCKAFNTEHVIERRRHSRKQGSRLDTYASTATGINLSHRERVVRSSDSVSDVAASSGADCDSSQCKYTRTQTARRVEQEVAA